MQVDTSLERTVCGLGIGLTLVKNLWNCEWRDDYASSEGANQGSEFEVRLSDTRRLRNPIWVK